MCEKTRMKKFDEIVSFFDNKLKIPLQNISEKIKNEAQEIRLRLNRCTAVLCFDRTCFIDTTGQTHDLPSGNFHGLYPTASDIENYLSAVCNYSIYSFQEQIKKGFITTPSGNRIGICGTAVIKNNQITSIRNVTSLNLRIANEFPNCSSEIFEKIKLSDNGILIAGPPKCGKTTLLRDLAKKISSTMIGSNFKKVVIADERSEIAANFYDYPYFDVGFSDVLTGFSKKEAFEMAIRCESPDVIICDEIGAYEDADALNQSLNAGVRVIASIHAKNLKELKNRPQAKKILASGAFEKIIFLDNNHPFGKIKNIYEVSEINL